MVSLLRDFVSKHVSSEAEGAARLRKLVNIRNELGETAVHYASRVTRDKLHYPQEDRDIIKLLCVNGGSLDLLTTKVRGLTNIGQRRLRPGRWGWRRTGMDMGGFL